VKEFTEIKIAEPLLQKQKEIFNKDFFHFDSKTSDLTYTKYIGTPISLESDILTLSTQMYFDNIPLSEMNTGVQIEFFNNSRKEEKLGEGIVISKYYQKAKREDWKISKEINNSNFKEIGINFNLNKNEKEALELGEIPLSMDDKWFLYCFNNEFHFYRSWTGIEMFKGTLIESNKEEGNWIVDKISVSKHWDPILGEQKAAIITLLKLGISRRLKILT